ncbi:alpha-L-fucosidase [Prevotella sp. KH2C16]|uniref:alpha-L-fucosidase n=1 Tax=Prevotella sp. KH2C16 TaxID=1855325 RepID=UPI0008F443B2|nr:alpha-L-fucosidase [Prevotella sp. KH2C16]SFG48053.1 alpha-L-fucosidase [Prevotella sp. KH2C16]
MKKSIILILALLPFLARAQETPKSWEELDRRPIPQWWTDAKFGIFIHWGLYSVPAYAPVKEVEGVYEKYAEHYYARLLNKNKLFTDFHNKTYGKNFRYADFATLFKAEHFNPEDWSSLFEKSGAKYVVLTSKHHDGFCLWNSTQSPQWNSVVMGPHIDIIDSLSRAVRRHGLHFGLYYSLLEWAHPLYSKGTISRWVDEHMIPQVQELVSLYRPEVIFADGEWDYDSETLQSRKLLTWLYDRSPVKNTVVVNDRWGAETRSKHGGYYTTEYNLVHNTEGIGDKAFHPWEESRGIGTSYGYNRFESVEDYLSAKELIRLLARTVANGGNLLLDIGPDANGLIPVIMQERLLQMGQWLQTNGEAIYSSKPWRKGHVSEKEAYCTQRDGNLYIICTQWPEKPLRITGLDKAGKVEMLGYTGKIGTTFKNLELVITPPQINPNQLPSQLAWVFRVKNTY